MNLPPNVLGSALAVLCAVCYGASLPLSRLAYDHGTNAITVLTLRYLALVLALSLWLRLMRRSLLITPRLIGVCFLVGLCFFATSGGTLAAVVYIPVSLAVLVFYTYPIITLALVSVIERRAPSAVDLIAILAGFVGVGLALEVKFERLDPLGIGLALVAALGVAFSLILASRALPAVGAVLVSAYASASAFLMGLATMLGMDALSLPRTHTGTALLVLVIILFGTAIVSMLGSLRLIGPVRSATLLCLEPVTAIVIAVLALGESLSPQQWLGGVLVGIAMLLAARRPAS